MNKGEIQGLIEDKVFHTGGVHKVLVDTDNGIPSIEDIEGRKRDYLSYLMTHIQDSVVKAQKNYPKHEKMVLDLSADFIVMGREDFDKIVKYIDSE